MGKFSDQQEVPEGHPCWHLLPMLLRRENTFSHNTPHPCHHMLHSLHLGKLPPDKSLVLFSVATNGPPTWEKHFPVLSMHVYINCALKSGYTCITHFHRSNGYISITQFITQCKEYGTEGCILAKTGLEQAKGRKRIPFGFFITKIRRNHKLTQFIKH